MIPGAGADGERVRAVSVGDKVDILVTTARDLVLHFRNQNVRTAERPDHDIDSLLIDHHVDAFAGPDRELISVLLTMRQCPFDRPSRRKPLGAVLRCRNLRGERGTDHPQDGTRCE